VIIPKPGKPAYDTSKTFRPIVLLNTSGKLIEKMIARRLQFDTVKYIGPSSLVVSITKDLVRALE